MRVFLTKPELETEAGKQLFELTVRIARDGELKLDEIKELRRWLRAHKGDTTVAAIDYLYKIMARITANGVIDRDEFVSCKISRAAAQARRMNSAA